MSGRSGYVRDQVELEECLNKFAEGDDVESTVVPRWKRKQEQQDQKRSRARSKSRTPSRKQQHNDRFIPNRGAMDIANAHFNLMKENDMSEDNRKYFNEALAKNMGASKSRVLTFKSKAPKPSEDAFSNSFRVLYSQNSAKLGKGNRPSRHIPSAPERILDAPELMDDYYLNLMDWGTANVLAVALGQSVYLWNASNGDIKELCKCENEEDYISSVKFVQEGGGYLAVGTNFNETQLWDIETCKLLRSMDGHNSRVSSLSWNNHILSSGGRDSVIVNHDVRVAQHRIGVLQGHTQEVCGLSWSPDGQTLASGSNDNLLCLWDARHGIAESASSTSRQQPRLKLGQHLAAVKALAWSPHQRNVLASGGGTVDRTIKLWNAANGACLNSVDTGSQVCALMWNPHERELLSSHGFSENQLSLWKYPSMVRTKDLTGHTARVLHLAASPCGTIVCSGAADETLRFWKVFEPVSKSSFAVNATGSKSAKTALNGMNIR